MVWRAEDPQGDEAGKIKHMIVPYTRGPGLDIGCGPWKAWPHMIGVDNFDEYAELEGWRPDIQSDGTDLSMFADGSMPFVFSSHLLEHLDDTEAVLREWWRVIKPGGYLVLYLPHADLYPRMGEEGANPDHKHDFLPGDITKLILKIGYSEVLVDQVRDKGREYSFFQVYRKHAGPIASDAFAQAAMVKEDPNPQRKKTCIVSRYGGYGDMLMVSSVLPALKDKGYRITMNTTPRGEEVLRHDPNIDDWWIQDTDQVPNHELSEYWQALGQEFDKAINFSESIEGALLAIPGRRVHALSHSARHLLMNVNYLEFTHAIAGVPGPVRQRFYASDDELQKAGDIRKALGSGPVIAWVLSGSSVHKTYPWVDAVVAWTLDEYPKARFVMLGGAPEQLLEFALCQQLLKHIDGTDYETSHKMKLSGVLKRLKRRWGGVNRVLCKSGSWSMRESMAFAQQADIVVGPETGVMHAVAFESEPRKIVMLSHSSHQNLTRDWVNTKQFEPYHVPCYPCHRMHYTREFCHIHEETGASQCAAEVAPRSVFDSIRQAWRPLDTQEPSGTPREGPGTTEGLAASGR